MAREFTGPLLVNGHVNGRGRAFAGGSAARSGRSAMFLFGVLWLAVLAAELTIAYQFLKAKIRHH